MDLVTSEMAITPLYENAPVSVLQALQQHFTWFTQHPSVSKEAFSEMLYTLHHGTLPRGNLLPDSYDKAMAVIKEYVIKPVVYHCCPNDCITFRGDTADLIKCSKCGADRYLRGKIPAKSFTYFPLKPRLIRMFETPRRSEMIQSHKACLDSPSDMVYNIQQSRVWKHAYSSNGLYQGDVRGVSLASCADGVNPFRPHLFDFMFLGSADCTFEPSTQKKKLIKTYNARARCAIQRTHATYSARANVQAIYI